VRQGLRVSFSTIFGIFFRSVVIDIEYGIYKNAYTTRLVKLAIASSGMADFKPRIEKTKLIWHAHIGLSDTVIRILPSILSFIVTCFSFLYHIIHNPSGMLRARAHLQNTITINTALPNRFPESMTSLAFVATRSLSRFLERVSFRLIIHPPCMRCQGDSPLSRN